MDFKHYLKINLKVLGAHITAQIISVVFWIFAFAFLSTLEWGKYVVSVFFSCFYFVWLYSCAYKVGERDSKSYSEHKPYPLKGVTMTVLVVVLGVTFALLYHVGIANQETNRLMYIVCENLLAFWNFNICAFAFYPHNIGAWFYILSFSLVILAPSVGYAAGIKRLELGYKIMSKLVYKNKK